MHAQTFLTLAAVCALAIHTANAATIQERSPVAKSNKHAHPKKHPSKHPKKHPSKHPKKHPHPHPHPGGAAAQPVSPSLPSPSPSPITTPPVVVDNRATITCYAVESGSQVSMYNIPYRQFQPLRKRQDSSTTSTTQPSNSNTQSTTSNSNTQTSNSNTQTSNTNTQTSTTNTQPNNNENTQTTNTNTTPNNSNTQTTNTNTNTNTNTQQTTNTNTQNNNENTQTTNTNTNSNTNTPTTTTTTTTSNSNSNIQSFPNARLSIDTLPNIKRNNGNILTTVASDSTNYRKVNLLQCTSTYMGYEPFVSQPLPPRRRDLGAEEEENDGDLLGREATIEQDPVTHEFFRREPIQIKQSFGIIQVQVPQSDKALCLAATNPGAATTEFEFQECSYYDDKSQIPQFFRFADYYSSTYGGRVPMVQYLGGAYSTTQSPTGLHYELDTTNIGQGDVTRSIIPGSPSSSAKTASFYVDQIPTIYV